MYNKCTIIICEVAIRFVNNNSKKYNFYFENRFKTFALRVWRKKLEE